jgi:hypothetical protein
MSDKINQFFISLAKLLIIYGKIIIIFIHLVLWNSYCDECFMNIYHVYIQLSQQAFVIQTVVIFYSIRNLMYKN